MATSGTFTFNLDIDEVIEEAMEMIGGEQTLGHEPASARRSLNLMLKDWKEAPTFDDIISRFDAGSFVMLQYYKNEPIGWFWGNTRLTYNWIDIIKDLPSANSMYGGGSYITKNKNIPKNTGIQLYTKFFHDIFDFYKSAYGYVDSWNKAPIRLNKRSGAIEINNLL